MFRQFLYDAGQAVKLLSSYLVPIVFSSVPYEEQPIASNVLTNSLRFMLHDTSSSAILRTLGIAPLVSLFMQEADCARSKTQVYYSAETEDYTEPG